MWCVYILKCVDGSFYTGHTNNLHQRVERHNNGRGASYTAARRPVVLVWHEYHDTRELASRWEFQIKRWRRAKKKALIEGNVDKLSRLAKCNSKHCS